MSDLSLADLTVDELKELIRQVVSQTIVDLIRDPDLGLELTDEMKLNVSQSLEKDFGEGDLVSAQDLATRMGLEW